MTDQTPRLGDYFTSRREKGRSGLPTLSVTLDRGLVRRDTLERRTDTTLEAEEHLLVRKGDIAYNMMRMWQGASGMSQEDALVSPAYVVLTPRAQVDPRFVAHLFKLPEMVHRFWAYSYGLTEDRLRLYFNDFKRIPWELPSLPEQKKIADILSTWDRAIETTEKLLAAAEKQKQALMEQLLTGKRRLKGFKGEWEEVSFGNIVRLSKKRLDPTTAHKPLPCVELEHIEAGTGRLLGTVGSDEQASIKAKFSPGDILFGKLRPYLRKFLAPEFDGVCSTEIWVLQPVVKAMAPGFLYALVQSEAFLSEANKSSGSKMPRADWTVVSEYRVFLPTMEEQIAIAQVVASLGLIIEKLTSERAALDREKRALMQQLLTGKRRVAV